MSKIFFSLFLYCFTLNLSAQTIVEWLDEKQYDFGELVQGKAAQKVFYFKNIGSESIVIENIRSTCGCTAPDWQSTPIPVDSIGNFTIKYDAKKAGYFSKKVKVYFSGQRKPEKLLVEGYVEAIE